MPKVLPENIRAIQNWRFMQMTGTLPTASHFGGEKVRTLLLFREIEDLLSELKAKERGKREPTQR